MGKLPPDVAPPASPPAQPENPSLQDNSSLARRVALFLSVFQKDILFTLIPLLVVGFVGGLMAGSVQGASNSLYEGTDVSFATIVLLGLAITQSAEMREERQSRGWWMRNVLSTRILIVMLIAAVVVLGILLYTSKGHPPTDPGPSTAPHDALRMAQVLLFGSSLIVLFLIQISREKAFVRSTSTTEGLSRSEFYSFSMRSARIARTETLRVAELLRKSGAHRSHSDSLTDTLEIDLQMKLEQLRVASEQLFQGGSSASNGAAARVDPGRSPQDTLYPYRAGSTPASVQERARGEAPVERGK